MKFLPVQVACVFVFLAATVVPAEENYPQFRGTDQIAVSPTPLPVRWSDVEGQREGVRWKVDPRGEGWSQPVVWEDHLYLTTAVPTSTETDTTKPENVRGGYGRDRDDLVNVVYDYQVVCIDRATGDEAWRRTVKTSRPPIPRHTTNTYATETPAVDGSRIYAYFGMNGVHCLDLDGKILWQTDLGVFEMRAGWGTASSIALLDNRLFVQVDNEEQSFLVCLDTATGKEVWRTNRPERSQYSSPYIWKNSQRTELIVGGMVYRSYDPETGRLLWQIDMNKGRSSATPIALGDRLFIGNELRNRGGSDDGGGRLYCIVPGGQGDITPPNDATTGDFVRWRMDESGIQMASPIYCQEKLFFFQRNAGVVTCVDALSGEKVFKSRVRGARAFWASPWTDGRHVYALDSSGNTHVIKPGESLDVIAVNELGDQMSWATPAFADGQIYLRTIDHLYSIARRGDVDGS
ncbi:PQQ-binding-like beta-propeller repeat protein [Roseiconus lacunae]|uniref:outer membrane protein assembly factor BamB family protein n=1 Tax=Roseiconus lacunae TaxID=2605694 RepID=UPI001E56E228|nr:PQQ-binding-like beta-propeller repeat protein [Roseiconus lacunae]MCD0463039.1 PQQ-like beta-propeller repeat protein [Roseiconus lacunae]WRQ53193.1 PQQ-binding-like beta-propeller repeat protein [Stieleria sp. HD01]